MTAPAPLGSASGAARAAAPALTALALPIALENLFRILIQSVDTVMLSSFSQEAVAGSGMVGQYLFFMTLLFGMVCTGAGIVLSQYLGAGRLRHARQVAAASVVMVVGASLVLSLVIFLGAGPLLSLYTLEPAVRDYAWQFLVIFGGGGAVFMALSQVQGTILRAWGHARTPMVVAMVVNVINIVGNALSLFGWFGLPVLGVVGVAASSVLAQAVGCLLLALKIRSTPAIRLRLRGFWRLPAARYRAVLAIGVPTAGEGMSYNVASIVLTAFVSGFGTAAMSAQVYVLTIVRFVFAGAASIGQAAQIKTGWLVGSGNPDHAYRQLWRWQAVATALTLALIVAANLASAPLLGLFTHDPAIAGLAASLLALSIYVEFGRSLNLVTISALKGAGDVRFPVFYGLFSMWFIMVLGAWLLGVRAGWGLAGIWLAIGTDETTRGFVMLGRWRSRRWMGKALA